MSSLERKISNAFRTAYTKAHFSRDLMALYASRTLMRISLSVIGVFLPIFFYKEFGGDLEMVIAIFLSLYGIHMLLTPLSAKLLSVWGTKRMIVAGIVFLMLATGALYYFPHQPALATIAYIMFASIYRALYWVPYHVDFAHALDETMRGRQLAILRNIANIILVAVPFIGGIIIATFGFEGVFLVSLVLMVFALVPLRYLSHTYERYSWGFIESFMHLFARGNRSMFLAHAANGAQGAATLVFWPIYVFTLLDERYTALGIIASLTLIVIILLRSIAGRLYDTWSHRRMLVVGVVMAATGWFTKIFVSTPLQVFAADTYHSFGKTVNALSMDAATYEQSADNGRYVDEYTALREMALGIGRMCMLLLIAVLVGFFDMRVAFVVAAFVALGMLLFNTHESRIT